MHFDIKFKENLNVHKIKYKLEYTFYNYLFH